MDSMIKDMLHRSSGDGMDNTLISVIENPLIKSSTLQLGSKSSHAILKSMQPVEPLKIIITPTPRYVPNKRKAPKFLIGKPKEPKFVPYEPYKGAVDPIVPRKRILQLGVVSTKNNVDINDLVTQLSDVRVAELKKTNFNLLENDCAISRQQWENEKKAYELDIKNLRATNSHLENQLKFQVQVNSELKTLLVAAVGEDLESRVQHLTEDKLQLARALLNSTDHLTSHQEKTEWLSGQCEVWRSKFLASSVMVEELARWKSALTNRINDLQDIIKNLLHERNRVRSLSLKTYDCLMHILKYLKVPDELFSPLKTTNILELSAVNTSLSGEVAQRVLKDDNLNKVDLEYLSNLPKNTSAEHKALQVSNMQISLLNKPDLICKALIGAAMSITGEQMFLQHPDVHATCCAHCKGKIENI